MEKITKKELNIKKDYICINVYHERYSADMCMQIYKNKSILEILQDHHCCEEIDISKIERQGYHGMGYSYDCCGHYELDKYSLTKKECKRFRCSIYSGIKYIYRRRMFQLHIYGNK